MSKLYFLIPLILLGSAMAMEADSLFVAEGKDLKICFEKKALWIIPFKECRIIKSDKLQDFEDWVTDNGILPEIKLPANPPGWSKPGYEE